MTAIIVFCVPIVLITLFTPNYYFQFPGDIANVLICAGCLGSRSDDFNEIVECDGCGVTVHEGIIIYHNNTY